MKSKIKKLVIQIFCFSVTIFIRLLRPFISIQFGIMPSQRIGHFAFDSGYLYARKKSGLEKGIQFYTFSYPIANQFWAEMVSRYFRTSWLVQIIYNLEVNFWKSEKHLVKMPERSRDRQGMLRKVSAMMPFSPQDNARVKKWMQSLGLAGNEEFVCLLVRDSAYLSQKFQGDWSYHNFRDTKIKSYEDSIQYLLKCGYVVFRMGQAANEAVSIKHPHLIDYPFLENKEDLYDIWLMANCKFAISGGIGLDSICDIYDVPVAYVNYIPFSNMNSWSNCITVPKKLRFKSSQKFLNLKQILKHNYQHSQDYKEADVEIVDLTSNEILDVVIELNERLLGTWNEPVDASTLQQEFWSKMHNWESFPNFHGWVHSESRIGYKFLETHRDILFAE